MPENVHAPAHSCPTCPAGVCPDVNTRPTSPQPAERLIQLATARIPHVLSQEFGRDDRYEALAAKLVERLGSPEYGAHLRAASEWAVHNLIDQGLLTPHVNVMSRRVSSLEEPKRQFNDGRFIFERANDWVEVYSEIENPAAFDSFIVRAEQALWARWRKYSGQLQAHSSGIQKDAPTYTPSDIKNLMDVSLNTVRKYAQKAQVKVPNVGKRDWNYSTSDLKAILLVFQRKKDYAERASKALELLRTTSKKISNADLKLQT
jgi:hypothetical protein